MFAALFIRLLYAAKSCGGMASKDIGLPVLLGSHRRCPPSRRHALGVVTLLCPFPLRNRRWSLHLLHSPLEVQEFEAELPRPLYPSLEEPQS